MDTEMTCYESFAEVTEDFYCSAVDVLKILVLRLHDYHHYDTEYERKEDSLRFRLSQPPQHGDTAEMADGPDC